MTPMAAEINPWHFAVLISDWKLDYWLYFKSGILQLGLHKFTGQTKERLSSSEKFYSVVLRLWLGSRMSKYIAWMDLTECHLGKFNWCQSPFLGSPDYFVNCFQCATPLDYCSFCGSVSFFSHCNVQRIYKQLSRRTSLKWCMGF